MNFGSALETPSKSNRRKYQIWVVVWIISIYLGEFCATTFIRKLYYKLDFIVGDIWTSQERSLLLEIFINNRYVFEILTIMLFWVVSTCLLLVYDNFKKEKSIEK